MGPVSASGEDRLDALERQQKHDHMHFQAMGKTLQNVLQVVAHQGAKFKELQQASAEHTQMGLNLRREIYAMKGKVEGELRSAGGTIEARLPGIIEQAASGVAARIAATEASVEQLKSFTEKHVEYLNVLQEARPKEGQALAEGFQHVSQEVGRVRKLVGQMEAKTAMHGNVFKPDSTALSKEMLDALRDMHAKVNGMAQLYHSYNAMYQKLEQNIVATESLGSGWAEMASRIDNVEAGLDAKLLDDGPPAAEPLLGKLELAVPA